MIDMHIQAFSFHHLDALHRCVETLFIRGIHVPEFDEKFALTHTTGFRGGGVWKVTVAMSGCAHNRDDDDDDDDDDDKKKDGNNAEYGLE
jgi:hypothetical protein